MWPKIGLMAYMSTLTEMICLIFYILIAVDDVLLLMVVFSSDQFFWLIKGDLGPNLAQNWPKIWSEWSDDLVRRVIDNS